MPPGPVAAAGCGLGKRLLAMPADLWDDHYHLVHLLDRQQRAKRASVAGLAASFAS